ncbi:7-carboxy-7-deazaguanine synthase QueE [Planctomycetota bacterium]
MIRIVEIFYSLQGEGFLAGRPSVFIRLAGCPLRCGYCDTKYAWDESAGKDYSIEQIVEAIEKYPAEFVVVTGGEPMVNPELGKLVTAIKAVGKHITIETAGIAFATDLACDLMSISPKLSNATPDGLDVTVLRQLVESYEYQFKFVVDRPADIDEIDQTLTQIPNVDMAMVMLMPQATSRAEYLEKAPMVAQLCKQAHLAFSPRLQTILWNNERQF